MSTKSRLDALYLGADKICIGEGSRIVLMSDCHRGVGNHGDNFLYNQNLAAAALSYYDRRQFTYVELGDGDELWENRRIEPVIRMHDDIFETLSRLYRQGRFIMLYGNHDRKKSSRVLWSAITRIITVSMRTAIRSFFRTVWQRRGWS